VGNLSVFEMITQQFWTLKVCRNQHNL